MTTGLLITNTGAARIAADLGGGADLALTHVAWGDSAGVPYAPNVNQVALVNERYRSGIASVAVVAGAIVVEATIPADIPDLQARPSHGFNVAEIGLFASNGDLIGVARASNGYKAPPSSGQAQIATYQLKLAVANPSAITVVIDPVATIHLGRQLRPFFVAVDGLLNAPPVGPASGATYAIGAAPTGAWTGFPNRLAQWTGGVWALSQPPTRHLVADRSKALDDAARYLRLDPAGWVAETFPLDTAAGDARYVLKAGDTMSGDLYRNGPAGTNRMLGFNTANVARWREGCSNETEVGSNSGSNRFWDRYSDAGALLGRAMQLSRFNGLLTLERRPVWPGAIPWDSANYRRQRVSWSTPGSYQWTVPADVTRIRAKGVGGGGGAAGMRSGTLQGGGAGGAGAGADDYLDVTPGEILNIVIGAGGLGGAVDADGGNGGSTSILGRFSLNGGAKGSADANAPAGGFGGVLVSGSVDWTQGGDGTDGDPGNARFAGSGGASIYGGGGRSSGNNVGQPGRAPGTGGGSAYGTPANAGGPGKAGKLEIWF